jgi:lysophospholipase L1-like esterase
MQWYEEEVRGLERAHAAHPPPAGAVLFYGSSSFRLWSSLADDMRAWPVVNRAFGGSTLAACVHFFERLVTPVAPRSLLVYAGDNDLGDGQAPEQVVASFAALLAKVDAQLGPIPLGFVSIKPSPARWNLREQIVTVNDQARGLLRDRPLGYYIDVFGPMLGSDGRPRLELFAEDMLHLSPAGYRLWDYVIKAYRGPLLDP